MRSYSQRHANDATRETIDEDSTHQLNNISSDIKLRRTSMKENL